MNTIQVQIKNPARFFSIAKKDYSCWKTAWTREVVQNSYDAGSSVIKICIGHDEHGYYIQCEDNGCGMTRDILVNKFFALGESGKDFENTIGGFGKAKELIVFSHPRYIIHTNNIFVGPGCGGAAVKIDDQYEKRDGTLIRIWPGVDEKDKGKRICESMISYARQYLNGCTLKDCDVFYSYIDGPLNKVEPMGMGILKVENERFDLYINKNNDSYKKYMLVRINGVLMYKKYISYDFPAAAIVELKGPSFELINANRDGVKYSFQSKLDEIVSNFISNPIQSTRDTSKVITELYVNEGLIEVDREVEPIVSNKSIKEIDWSLLESPKQIISAIKILIKENCPIEGFKNSFMIRKVGSGYPMKMGRKAAYLALLWAKIVREVYISAGYQDPFGVGFTFEEEAKALFIRSNGRCYYLINPKTLVLRDKIVLIRSMFDSAIHEVSHTFHTSHNESFVKEMHKIRDKLFSTSNNIKRIFSKQYAEI